MSKESLIAEALETEEGRIALANAIVEPMRGIRYSMPMPPQKPPRTSFNPRQVRPFGNIRTAPLSQVEPYGDENMTNDLAKGLVDRLGRPIVSNEENVINEEPKNLEQDLWDLL